MRRTHKRRNHAFLYTVTICLACLFTFQAKGLSQPGESFTLKANNIPLAEVFKNIYKQTRLKVTYSNLMFNDKEKIDVDFRNSPIRDVMAFLLKGKDLNFDLADNLIIISRKENSRLNPSLADTLINIIPSLKGKVIDGDGKPVPGATVVVKGTQRGTTTEGDGNFALNDVKKNSFLLVSSIGFETRELAIKGASILIKLNIVVNALDETIIKGYYTTSQRMNTGNVNTVKASDIEKQPVNNPLLALQGRVPGMDIIQNSGVPGSGIVVRIRGVNSIRQGNDPLYVVDGVPYPSQMLQNKSDFILRTSGNNGGNPLSFISPSDIESISILKDADATAIYGSRGANGVVLITTKQGKPGKTRVDIDVSSGIGSVARKMNFLDTDQYLQMRREAFKNDGETPTPIGAPDLLTWDTTRYTDWQKVLIGSTAHYTRAQASLSGGSENTQFLIGASYQKETTVFPGDFSDKKASLHFNIGNISNNKKLKTNFSGSYLRDINNLLSQDLAGYIALPPNAPEAFNPDGSLNWANSTWPDGNPFALIKKTYNSRTNNLVSNLNVNYQLLEGLNLKASFGFNNMQVSEVSTSPIASGDPSYTKTGNASFTDNKFLSWIVEPQVSYEKNIGDGKIEALVGTTFQESKSEGSIIDGIGYSNDELLESIQAAATLTVNSVTNANYKYNAVYARLSYNWQDKILLNLTARKDGSSRFGDNNKFHSFGGAGAAWIFSRERFIQNSLRFLSFGKLRGSIGTTGSDQIQDYLFYDLYGPTFFPYQGIVGLTPARIYNPNLQWEETKKIEGGIELGFLNDKIFFTASYYRNRSSNQLLSSTLPNVTGFGSLNANFPATVQNNGWEVVLNTTNIKSGKFGWSSSFNLTVSKNRLIAFPNIDESAYKNALVIGQPTTIVKSFHLAGVNDTAGVFQFFDSKGSLTSAPTYIDDQKFINNTSPKFYGGLNNSFTYKNFQLEFLFQFVKQTGRTYLPNVPPGMMLNLTQEAFTDRWHTSGDKSLGQMVTQSWASPATSAYYYFIQSDGAYTDASFIRLKNVSFSFNFPQKWISYLHLQNGRIYLTGQNLLTITKYKGLDPENSAYASIPPLRVVTAGIKVSL